MKINDLTEIMFSNGAHRILIKRLANNDNSKQQIYLGSDFDVIKIIPSGDMYSAGVSKKGPIFKAPLNLFWIDSTGNTEQAKNSQIIFYPNYPETRMSGFLKGCSLSPSHLMQPPTPQQRQQRANRHRFLVLGVSHKSILAFCSGWEEPLSEDLDNAIKNEELKKIATVFYEYAKPGKSTQQKLIEKLISVYKSGEIESCRLNKQGAIQPYTALNGAGYTLEAQFGITPNGCSDPDFFDWELKAHSGSVVTLMTPEPDIGTYLDDLETFLRTYGTSRKADRLDFASRHIVGSFNTKTALTMHLDGYDPASKEIIDPSGGLFLKNNSGEIVAGWRFDKIIDHWKKKHSNTCFVFYTTRKSVLNYYSFGPQITLGKGTSLDRFLDALYTSVIYYDPGINMKFNGQTWKPKKRNQFRVKWKNISMLYKHLQHIDLSDI
ncbi:MvaI/BcnI family restriction endonuclease [uncultured Rheinheimera sp.]|uniref:MvaI/BcnI family restriction endonuclease n=1 Tax=uncultured Rheinheimera sp. TaxID=400532 RepID=UPI002596F8FF|nr:MvaI/BcnI family restriction endonuclease [uncultured Rheinheimera sp.]